MQQAIDILDEMIKENIQVRNFDLYGSIKMNVTARYIYERIEEEITRAKEKIQAIQPKVPTITIPEGTVLIGKDEYESLKEKSSDGWIPMTERKPPHLKESKFWTDYGEVIGKGVIEYKNGWVIGEHYIDKFNKYFTPTHWMPLPNSPKQ